MALDKQGNFSQQPSELPDVPSPSMTPDQIRAKWQTPLDELKTTVNTAFDKLNSTTDGASGADNIGATGFDGTPSTPQAMLEDLNTRKADTGTNWTGTWQGFSPSQVDQTIRDQVNTNTSQLADISSFLPQPSGVDDTNALQNIFNNLSNKTVTISHDYIVGAPSTVAGSNTILSIVGQSNFKIKGNNGSIKLKDHTGNKVVLVIVDCSNFEIDGLVIDGNKSNQTLVNTGDSRFLSENCPAILLENAKTFKVKNCSLKNAQGDGIQLDVNYLNQSNTSSRQCEDGEIYDNTIDGVGRNGVSFVHTKNVEAWGNNIKNIHQYSTTLAAGIDIEVNPTYNFKNENIKVHHNFIRNCDVGTQVIMAGDNDLTQNVKVYQNSYEYCGNAIQEVNLLSTNGSDIDIMFNVIYKCNNGITIDTSNIGRTLYNIIEKCVRTGTSDGFGIITGSIRQGQNTNQEIKFNKISDCDSNGIYAQTLSDSFIEYNDVKNTSISADVTEKVAIRILGTCANNKINKNRIDDSSIPIGITELTGTITNIEISGNDIITTNNTIYWLVLADTTQVKKTLNRVNGVQQNECTAYTLNVNITVPANSIYNYQSTILFSDNNRSILVTPLASTDKVVIKPKIQGGNVQIDFVNNTAASITFTSDINILVFNHNNN